ncbi:acyl-CoA carboxylase epsilon subunit [Streptomyces sp. NPDC058657]|uniref:acyl-CoA carboxylase epsilon subunit n=1 Tax=unclassified Streptomyces TaxID=2593676 RepID=UPI0036645D15
MTTEPLTAVPATAESLTAAPLAAEPLTAVPATAESLTAAPPAAGPTAPWQITGGQPSAEETAALTAVLTALLAHHAATRQTSAHPTPTDTVWDRPSFNPRISAGSWRYR